MIRLPDLLDNLGKISYKYEQAEQAADVLRAVSKLHQPDRTPGGPQTVFCLSCTNAWPCPTTRALGDRDGAPA